MSNTTNNSQIEALHSLMKADRWPEAVELAETMLADDSTNHQVLWDAGWSHFQMEHYDEAVSYLSKAVDVGPVTHSYFRALGEAFLAQENYELAEIWLLRALAIRDSTVARLGLALTYLSQGQVEIADAVHKEGLRLQPNDCERHESYANFLSDVEREDEANAIRQKASKLSGGDDSQL